MKKGFVKTIILAAGFAFIILIVAGCQKETTISQKGTMKTIGKTSSPAAETRIQQTSDKAARAAGAENIELRKQLAAKDKEIENLKQELVKRPILKSKDLVPKAEVDKKMADLGNQMIDMFEENMKLQEENKILKKQIEELRSVKQK